MRALALAFACVVLAACASNTAPANNGASETLAYDAAAVPSGPVGDSIRYGRELMLHTRAHLKGYVAVRMDCAACHIDGGTRARAGSFVGTAAAFPQWNARSHRVITLHDRLAECFLYSMNGHPPAYHSREMIALAAYITYLSRGIKLGTKPDKAVALASITLPNPNRSAGEQLYSQKCSKCHGADGDGKENVPPLWGAGSFNGGAGMHRLRTMAGFIRYNMPKDAPGSLSDRQAFDIAAYVLSHSRPAFQKNRTVSFPDTAAGYF